MGYFGIGRYIHMVADLTTPVHIDFTTLYGAALCIERSVIESEGVPVSRLLSLSQLVEAIVLHDRLEFELGNTADWGPYREALEKKTLYRLISAGGFPLRPSEVQVDGSENEIVEAARWVVEYGREVELRRLKWATRFRSGTYDAFSHASDQKNPVVRHYLDVVDSVGEAQLSGDLEELIRYLQINDVGLLGVHVLMRWRLIQQALIDTHLSNYSPHFSRQPLVAALDPLMQVKEWTMEQLALKRVEILRGVEPTGYEDPLAVAISPILQACLRDAKTPLDILENALAIRTAPSAYYYRAECRELLERSSLENESVILKYKIRVADRLRDLSRLLFEKGSGREVVRQLSFDSTKVIPVGYNVAMRWTTRKNEVAGDRAMTFLRDIFDDSLDFLNMAGRIQEIFGGPLRYDAPLIGCMLPGSEQMRTLGVRRAQ
jgi:hypothetical protein